jgi:diaminopimelate epimerase
MKKKTLHFVKMQGAGNDFVFLTPSMAGRPMTATLARLLLDRHFGIGGDQLLFLKKSGAKLVLDIYNSDGSKAEMCGNGVRAVAYYLHRTKGVKKDFVLHTGAGPIGIGFKKDAIDVDMGAPILEGTKIPVGVSGEIINRPLMVEGRTFKIHCVSMGNPHCIVFVDDVENYPVKEYGPLIENHPFFPRRVNVEFVQVLNKGHVRARVWERGAGETLACGTGACAIAVASARIGKTDRAVKVDLPGGQLRVRWDTNNHVFLSGPAAVSYTGTFFI